MFPFAVVHRAGQSAGSHRSGGVHEGSGYELISFDAEKYNLFAAEVRYCEPHWHSAPELICVLTGSFTVNVCQRSHQVAAGGMVYINPDEIHALEATAANSRLLTIQFSPRLFDDAHPAPHIDYCRASWAEQRPQDRALRDAVLLITQRQMAQASSFAKLAAIYTLLSALEYAEQPGANVPSEGYSKRDGQLVKQSMHYIAEHLTRELNLSKMADMAGMSYFHFSRMFKKVSGYNFKEYLMILRTNKAKSLLKNTQIPITEISHLCGFKEHKHLNACFNKYCSVTPSEFRKRMLAGLNQPDADLAVMTDFRCLPLSAQVIQWLSAPA